MFSQPDYILLRKNSSGGGYRPNPPKTGSFRSKETIVLLIRGYNVSEEEAMEEFGKFRKNLEKQAPTRGLSIYDVYWPGDIRLRFMGMEGMVYPRALFNAKQAGKTLAESLLNDLEGISEINLVLIGHSLGCRLIFESLLAFSGKTPLSFSIKVILMAAAVPFNQIQSGRSLHAGLSVVNRGIHIFYSAADSVLRYLFRVGQFFGAEGWGGGSNWIAWPSRWYVSFPHKYGRLQTWRLLEVAGSCSICCISSEHAGHRAPRTAFFTFQQGYCRSCRY